MENFVISVVAGVAANYIFQYVNKVPEQLLKRVLHK